MPCLGLGTGRFEAVRQSSFTVGCASAHLLRLAGAACLACWAGAATAWSFAPLPVCTLTHEDPAGKITVTFDPAIGEYSISLTRTAGGWEAADSFAIAFLGPRPIRISTTRHQLSDDGRTLSVTDTGFGNVLDGLQFNDTAQADAGSSVMRFALDDARDPVAAFRACPDITLS